MVGEVIAHVELAEIEVDGALLQVAVEDAECPIAVLERLEPILYARLNAITQTLDAERILVDGNHLTIGDDIERLLRHGADIIAQNKRSGHHAPHREMCTVFGFGHAITYLKHIGIVPMTGAGKTTKRLVFIQDSQYTKRFPTAKIQFAIKAAVYITGSAPEMTKISSPRVSLRVAPFAEREHDIAARLTECLSHQCIRTTRIDVLRIAPIVFQIIDAPTRILERILILMSLRTGFATTGLRAGIRINTKVETERMNIISQGADATGETLGVGLNKAIRIALAMPAVVHIYIAVTCIIQARIDHRFCYLTYERFVDITSKRIP